MKQTTMVKPAKKVGGSKSKTEIKTQDPATQTWPVRVLPERRQREKRFWRF